VRVEALVCEGLCPHPQAGPVKVPRLVIADVDKLTRPGVVVDNLPSAVLYAPVRPCGTCAGVALLALGWLAEVVINAALAPDVAARVERAWPEVAKGLVLALVWRLRPWLLGTAQDVLVRSRHWRVALAYVDFEG
jgi:hypothetical protein